MTSKALASFSKALAIHREEGIYTHTCDACGDIVMSEWVEDAVTQALTHSAAKHAEGFESLCNTIGMPFERALQVIGGIEAADVPVEPVVETKPVVFKCTHDGCKKVYKSEQGLLTHVAKKHAPLTWSCHLCQKEYKTISGLEKHMSSKHSEPVVVVEEVEAAIVEQPVEEVETVEEVMPVPVEVGIEAAMAAIAGLGSFAQDLIARKQRDDAEQAARIAAAEAALRAEEDRLLAIYDGVVQKMHTIEEGHRSQAELRELGDKYWSPAQDQALSLALSIAQQWVDEAQQSRDFKAAKKIGKARLAQRAKENEEAAIQWASDQKELFRALLIGTLRVQSSKGAITLLEDAVWSSNRIKGAKDMAWYEEVARERILRHFVPEKVFGDVKVELPLVKWAALLANMIEFCQLKYRHEKKTTVEAMLDASFERRFKIAVVRGEFNMIGVIEDANEEKPETEAKPAFQFEYGSIIEGPNGDPFFEEQGR